MGLAATYHLARRGLPVTLIEQFAIGHNRGSSHGQARITRHSYSDPMYARLMPAAFDAWRKLEADAGETVFIRTGGISFSPPDVSYVQDVASSLLEIGIPHTRSTGRNWNRRQSAFKIPDDYDTVYEPDAGMLRAARILELEAQIARERGPSTVILEETPVLAIDLEASVPTLLTATGTIEAEQLIVTAGAWTSRLFPQLDGQLTPTRQVVSYLCPPNITPYSVGQFPVFIYKGAGDNDAFYGMPAAFGSSVKIARHGGPEVDPDLCSHDVDQNDQEPVQHFVEQFLPGLVGAPIDRTEVCIYTMAPEDHFQVGFAANRSDIIVASPCSGHGFKFSNLIGSILVDLATNGQTEHEIGAWRFDR
jgi:sarcosine oxidase